MLSHYNSTRHYHEEYVRRHVRVPDPSERPYQGLREAIGHGLIQLGERLTRADREPTFDRAA